MRLPKLSLEGLLFRISIDLFFYHFYNLFKRLLPLRALHIQRFNKRV
ncbi:hypothetical protein QFZ44_004390 [Pantoea agglomerans]|nr:hypothetical protein [Pantoea agglomerans]